MGPKGERGQPGSIVWNGIKVSEDVLIHSIEDEDCLIDLGRERRTGKR